MTKNRQERIAALLQRELAELFRAMTAAKPGRAMISVTRVRITQDFSHARVYLSVFPSTNAAAVLAEVRQLGGQLKHQVAQRIKSLLRKMPDLSFHLDDSLDYIEGVDRALKGEDDPLKEG